MKPDTSNAVRWNAWHGCHKVSEGCKNCWMHQIDEAHGKDGNIVTSSAIQFDAPLKYDRSGGHKIPSGATVLTCFTSDFFIQEADKWRKRAWEIMRVRSDLQFLLLTKRPERIQECLPEDWLAYKNGYPNVTLAVSCENQRRADERLPILLEIPVDSRMIFCSPLIGSIDLSSYLSEKIFKVSVGGENHKGARPCMYEWVESLYNQCVDADVSFEFWDIGSNFWMNNKRYHIRDAATRQEQATKSGLRYISSRERND